MSSNKLVRSLECLGGTLEGYWWLRLKLGAEPGFQKRWSQWIDWVSEMEASARKSTTQTKILVFAASSAWLDFAMATATVTAGYGPQVHYVWGPFSDWGPGGKRQQRYEAWARRRRPPLESSRLKVLNLLNLPLAPLEPWMHQEAETLSTMDTQYETKTEEIDLSASDACRQIYEHRLKRNLHCLRAITALLRENSYSKLIVPNGQVMELGACYRAARHHQLPCLSFELFEKKGLMGFNETRPASNSDTEVAWAADAPHVLDDLRRYRVAGLLAGREGTNWDGYYVAVQSKAKASAIQLRSFLNISTDNVALCCPNVSWDSSVLGVGRCFATMAEWLRRVARFFAEKPSWTLIIRCHPGERVWGTGQPGAGVVLSVFQQGLPANLRLLPAEDEINTYGLMEIADLGLVYTSTTGVEMAARGIPVFTAGWVHYVEKGFTQDPATEVDFWSQLDAFLMAPRRLTEAERDLVYCYLDVYFHRWPRAFPWHTTFRQDVKDWTIARVLSDEGHELFGKTFEYLAG